MWHPRGVCIPRAPGLSCQEVTFAPTLTLTPLGGLRCLTMAGAGPRPVQVHGDASPGRGARSTLHPRTPERTLATVLQEVLCGYTEALNTE